MNETLKKFGYEETDKRCPECGLNLLFREGTIYANHNCKCGYVTYYDIWRHRILFKIFRRLVKNRGFGWGWLW